MTKQLEASQSFNRISALTAIAALLFGIVAVSFSAIFIRISEYELGPYATIFHRLWIATIPLGLWVGVERWRQPFDSSDATPSHPLTKLDWGLLCAAGIILSTDLSLWALSLTRTSVANATVLANLAPVFTTLGAWLLWRQWFDNRFFLGLVIALGGAIAIGVGDLQLAPDYAQGDAIALLSAISFSAYLLTIEQLRTRLSASMIMLGSSVIGALITAVIALSLEDRLFPSSGQGWFAVIALALISQTLGQGLVAYSLNKISSGIVAIAFLLEPVLSATGAWVMFSETLSLLNGIAFALVIIGIYVAISSQSAMKEPLVESSH